MAGPASDGFVHPWPGPSAYGHLSATSTGYSTGGFPPPNSSAYPSAPAYPPPGYPPPAAYPQPGPSGYGPLGPGAGPQRRGPGGWVLAAAVVVAAGALTGLLATPAGNLPSLTGPSPTRPSASPSATPTAKPVDVLKKNPIYSLTVTGACPSQRVPASWKAFQGQVRALIQCENKAWDKALRTVSITPTKPKVRFYTKTTDSGCGHLDSKFPASYCPGDQTLYFSRASYQQGRYFRLSVSEFVFHEYAHHVQSMSGIFERSATLKEDEEITERRTELQAHCIAHYRLTHAGLKFSSRDRADIEYQLGYSADAEGHGSAKAGRRWGEAGLNGKTIGACNTWKAKASAVK